MWLPTIRPRVSAVRFVPTGPVRHRDTVGPARPECGSGNRPLEDPAPPAATSGRNLGCDAIRPSTTPRRARLGVAKAMGPAHGGRGEHDDPPARHVRHPRRCQHGFCAEEGLGGQGLPGGWVGTGEALGAGHPEDPITDIGGYPLGRFQGVPCRRKARGGCHLEEITGGQLEGPTLQPGAERHPGAAGRGRDGTTRHGRKGRWWPARCRFAHPVP